MTRSINTTLTTLFALIALYGWGGTTIRGFALALIIGITSGAYSSVFTASPIVALWNRRSAARKGTAAARSPHAARARRRTDAANDMEEDELAEIEVEEKVSASDTIRQAEAKAREEKRQTRKDRRKKKSDKQSRSRRF